MTTGIIGLAADLDRIVGQGDQGVGPGSYARIGRALRQLAVTESDAMAVCEEAWRERSFHVSYARPLLLLAAMRYQALGDSEHPLAPELLMDATGSDLEARLVESLRVDGLGQLLQTRSVQTNEAGRSIGWALVAMGLKLPNRGFGLVDMGCSAGLNLVADLSVNTWRVEHGPHTHQLSGLDLPCPSARLGLDASPVDLGDEEAVRWLRACIWPGDQQRTASFEYSLDAWGRAQNIAGAPRIERHILGVGETTAQLQALGDGPVLAFESVTAGYLSAPERERHYADMMAWVQGAPGRIWAALDPAPEHELRAQGGPMRLDVAIAPRRKEAERVLLARTTYHPRGCFVMPGATPRLEALWEQRA